MKAKDTNFYIAVALIIGTVIGAGVLGIPYVIAKTGWIPGMINFVVVGLITTLMTLYMGEVVIRTKKTRQFTGLAEQYLGQKGKWLMFSAVVVGMYGALIAYLVGIGQATAHLLGFGNPMVFTVLFFVFGAILVLLGLEWVSKTQLFLAAGLIIVIIFISFGLMPQMEVQNFAHNDFSKIFMPYGVILFACLGYSVMPEVEILMKNQKKKILPAIITAMVICLSLYAMFSLVMMGVFGTNVEQIATNSLSGVFNSLGSSVAILAMATGFLALGTVVKHTFEFDLYFNKYLAWAITVFIPLAIVLLISPSFIDVIGITGAYTGSLVGILACLMVLKARKEGDDKPTYVVPGGKPLIYLSMFIFVTGIAYQTAALLGWM